MSSGKLGIIALLVVLLAIIVIAASENPYQDFMKTASKTNGHIILKEERDDAAVVGKKVMWVTYAYTDSKGDQYTTQTHFEYADLWKKLREGQAQPVYYNKNNPSESYLGVVIDRKLGRN